MIQNIEYLAKLQISKSQKTMKIADYRRQYANL